MESKVFQNHRSNILKTIVNPLRVANTLVRERVVSPELAFKVASSANRTVLQKNAAIIEAVSASIHNDPSMLHVFLAVLETQAEAAPLASRMRQEVWKLELGEYCVVC